MLTQLVISNFAIIEKLEINLSEGLIVFTGETGAGKSIIADAINFLFSTRASTDLIKTGTNKAFVEATFMVKAIQELSLNAWFKKNDFEVENDRLIISREMTKDGSKARINGSVASVSHLSYLREYLIDIHEQSNQLNLLDISKHLNILDNFGDSNHKKLTEEYKKTYTEYTELKNNLDNYLKDSEQTEKKIDYLKFQLNEIKSAEIKDINEEEKLKTKREVLLNRKELIENTSEVYELINQENNNGLISILSQVKKLISKSNDHDKLFRHYLETIEVIVSEIKELSSFVKDYTENINADENTLNETEERLDLLYNLKRKYGKSLSEILEQLRKIELELNDTVQVQHALPLLEKQFTNKQKEINELLQKLTKSREEIAKEFVNKVNEELPKLGFKDALFVVEFSDCEFGPNGKEQVQFLFTSNPDEPPKPVLKVASGGELSRIMLAIKSIAGRSLINQANTIVFDEIDTGTSGETVANIARKLYKISKHNQVICITHQPIIAAMADMHILIKKEVIGGITQVFAKEVNQKEKAEALAMLLAPEKQKHAQVTEDAKQFAQSLLESASKIKELEQMCT